MKDMLIFNPQLKYYSIIKAIFDDTIVERHSISQTQTQQVYCTSISLSTPSKLYLINESSSIKIQSLVIYCPPKRRKHISKKIMKNPCTSFQNKNATIHASASKQAASVSLSSRAHSRPMTSLPRALCTKPLFSLPRLAAAAAIRSEK